MRNLTCMLKAEQTLKLTARELKKAEWLLCAATEYGHTESSVLTSHLTQTFNMYLWQLQEKGICCLIYYWDHFGGPIFLCEKENIYETKTETSETIK